MNFTKKIWTETSQLQKNNGRSIAPEFVKYDSNSNTQNQFFFQSFHSSYDNFELDIYPGFYYLLMTEAKFNGQDTIKNSEKLTDTLTDSPSKFFRKFYGQD